MNRKQILVTGGAGFIGSHIVDELVARGDDVIVLDNLDAAAHAERPDYLNPGAHYILEDVSDAASVRRAVDGAEAVCHQAARVGLGVDFADVTDYVADNDTGTAVLLGELFQSGFDGPLVLASSMVVYGEGQYRCDEHGLLRPGPRDEDRLRQGWYDPVCPRCERPLVPDAVTEDAQLDPRNVYAATKVHQEHLCKLFGDETGAPVSLLRYHNVYGPRMPRDTPYAGVASIFRSALAAGRAPQVYEDGGQRRDFVHVRDVAHANVLALDAGARGAFNIASGTPKTVGEMAAALAVAFPGAPGPEVTDAWRTGDVRHVVASPYRAAAVLGFRPEVSFADGMEELAAAPLRTPRTSRTGVRRR